MRRVVVTGLGAITPLGVGISRTWSRLLAGNSGITSTAAFEPRQKWSELTSTVAAVVPSGEGQGHWRPEDWLTTPEMRRMSTFTQYAVAASDMALKDAGWEATRQEDLEETGVCLGSGIGNLHEMYETSLAHNQGVCLPNDPRSPRHLSTTDSCASRVTRRCRPSLYPRSSSTWLLDTLP